MSALVSQEIHSRDEFVLLCNWRKLYRAVEVGVDRGGFAKQFMSHWQGHNYLGVDSYVKYPEFPWDRQCDFLIAVKVFQESSINCKLVRDTSFDIAFKLQNYSGGFFADLKKVDFIYLDGDHSYEAVKDDLQVWWPLVSDIGILAGHDYDVQHPGVVQAVDEFFADKGVVYRTTDSPASWYVYRTGIPGADWIRV